MIKFMQDRVIFGDRAAEHVDINGEVVEIYTTFEKTREKKITYRRTSLNELGWKSARDFIKQLRSYGCIAIKEE